MFGWMDYKWTDGNRWMNGQTGIEYLYFMSCLQYALTYEVQEATEINSLMRANTAITRMMTTYCRYVQNQCTLNYNTV